MKGKIFHDRYFVISTIKSQYDKGDVLRCLYFPKLSLPRFCLIKEGKKGMWLDDQGRDISDRLRWQQQVHAAVRRSDIVPAIFDLFKEQDNHYIAMQYIRGNSLARKIADVYKGRTWLQLSVKQQGKLLKHFLDCIESVEKFHAHSYVHRDLTPENFIVGKKNRIYLIDTELAYSIAESSPTPPFVFGTIGYMSPEQSRTEKPTPAEDYYAIGACLNYMLANMNSVKFQRLWQRDLSASLYFFSGEKSLIDLVCRSYSSEPKDRPALSEFRDKIMVAIASRRQPFPSRFTPPGTPEISEIEAMIRSSSLALLSEKHCKNGELFKVGSPNGAGLGLAISGLLFLVCDRDANEVLADFKLLLVDQLRNINIIGSVNKEAACGLVWGKAGNAMFYHYCSKLIRSLQKQSFDECIEECFNEKASNFDLSTGIAGQVLAMTMIYLDSPKASLLARIDELLDTMSTGQLKDGSWPLGKNMFYKDRFGLSVGLAGIVLVLIYCADLLRKKKIDAMLDKALKRLMSFKVADTTFANGSDGIALVFLKAYKYSGRREYLSMAEDILMKHPKYAVESQFSLGLGMAGLGVVYLDAAEITEKKEYLDRAIWIYRVLANTSFRESEETVSWMMNDQGENDGTLLQGGSGIVYFLVKLHAAIKKAGC